MGRGYQLIKKPVVTAQPALRTNLTRVLPYLQKIHILPVFACYSHSISVPVIPGCSRHSKDSCPTAPWPPQPAPGQPAPGQLTLTAATEASPGSRGCHTGSTPPVPNCPRHAKHALPGTAQRRAQRSTRVRSTDCCQAHTGPHCLTCSRTGRQCPAAAAQLLRPECRHKKAPLRAPFSS